MTELELLRWLAQEDMSQYGECYGQTLDALIEKGFAQVLDGREHQSGFITQGDDLMHRAVVVTDAGREELVRAGTAEE